MSDLFWLTDAQVANLTKPVEELQHLAWAGVALAAPADRDGLGVGFDRWTEPLL